MTRVLREHLALVCAAAFLGLFFVFNGGEHFMLSRLVMIAWLVLAVLAWKPLHKRFRAWAILFSYFQVSLPLILVSDPSASLSNFLGVLLLALFFSAIVLLFNRQKPIEQRRPDLAFMILNGHWELLAKNGVPADEIERMKRLTQEDRAALAESLRSTRCGGVGRGHKGLSGYDYRPGGQNDDWGYTYSYGYGVSHIDDDDD